MSFVPASELLTKAKKANTAVIAFICIDYNMVSAVIQAAEKTGKPAIIMLHPDHVVENKAADFKPFADMVKAMAEKASVPIALHLDHCSDEELLKQTIEAGFTSVMFDASRCELEENVRRTKAVVDYAHARGVIVEAELGSVGLASRYDGEKEDLFTKPDTVKYYVENTGVDSLAIAIGNAHGDYPYPPKLDLNRLDEIHAITDVILVLHGGSGIPDDQLEQAFSRGISKFNYGTDVLHAYDSAIRSYHEEHQPPESLDVLGIPEVAQAAMVEQICKKMKLVKL